jgi:hypothetical protein
VVPGNELEQLYFWAKITSTDGSRVQSGPPSSSSDDCSTSARVFSLFEVCELAVAEGSSSDSSMVEG